MQAPSLFVQIDRAFVERGLLAANLCPRRGLRFAGLAVSALRPLVGLLGALLGRCGAFLSLSLCGVLCHGHHLPSLTHPQRSAPPLAAPRRG